MSALLCSLDLPTGGNWVCPLQWQKSNVIPALKIIFQIVGGCWDVMGGRALRWRWGAEGRSPTRPRGSPPRQNDTTGVRSKGRRVRFQSGPRRSSSLVRVRERERRRLWISRIFLRFRTRRRGTPEPTPDPGAWLTIIEWAATHWKWSLMLFVLFVEESWLLSLFSTSSARANNLCSEMILFICYFIHERNENSHE